MSKGEISFHLIASPLEHHEKVRYRLLGCWKRKEGRREFPNPVRVEGHEVCRRQPAAKKEALSEVSVALEMCKRTSQCFALMSSQHRVTVTGWHSIWGERQDHVNVSGVGNRPADPINSLLSWISASKQIDSCLQAPPTERTFLVSNWWSPLANIHCFSPSQNSLQREMLNTVQQLFEHCTFFCQEMWKHLNGVGWNWSRTLVLFVLGRKAVAFARD